MIKRRMMLAGSAGLLLATRAHAAGVGAADFYAGRTITLVVPAGSGGSYGDYALLLAEHLPRFLPGAPSVVPQYLPGAGGMKASNFVANLAPKDGTVLYLMHENTTTQQLLSPSEARYKSTDFAPIGLLSSLNSALAVREGAARDLAGFRQNEVILASTGRGSYQFIVPALMNQLQGTKFKIITSYQGTSDAMLAVVRGEVQGMFSSLMSFRIGHPEWLQGKGAVIALQVGARRDPTIPDAPLLTEIAETAQEKSLYTFLSGPSAMGRGLVAPPGTPQATVDLLRAAFDALVADPEVVADAQRRQVLLVHEDWRHLRQDIADAMATDPAVVDLARNATQGG